MFREGVFIDFAVQITYFWNILFLVVLGGGGYEFQGGVKRILKPQPSPLGGGVAAFFVACG